MIKADDDVMVAVKGLIDVLKDPSLPNGFILGRKIEGNMVLRQGSKWLVE